MRRLVLLAVLAFLSLGFFSFPPVFASSQATNQTLSATPNPGGLENPITLTADLTNASSGGAVSGETISFSVSYDGGTSSSIGTSTTASSGYASITYTPTELGTYSFTSSFAGDATWSSSSASVSVPVQAISGWGIYNQTSSSEYLNSVLISPGSNWNIETPNLFQVPGSKSGSATFSYSIYDLTSFDMDEVALGSLNGTLSTATTPSFSYSDTFTLQAGGYTFSDVVNYNNGVYGVGSSYTRTMTTTFPNGSQIITNINSAQNTPVRFVFYYSQYGYYTIAWCLNPYPQTTLLVGNNANAPSAYNINTVNPLNINVTMSVSGSNLQFSEVKIHWNQLLLSQGGTSAYTLNNSAGGGSNNGILGAMFSAFLNPIGFVLSHIPSFFYWLATQGFPALMRALGMGWIVDAVGWLIDAILIMFAIIEATLPYLGIILLIINLMYVIKLDFAGLFNFYVQIYDVVANIATAIITFAQTVIDFIKGLTGGLGAADVAAAAAG